ncbi:MAG: hypothetical protein ACI9MC_003989, partial [Kiritimatiellia bacterium]
QLKAAGSSLVELSRPRLSHTPRNNSIAAPTAIASSGPTVCKNG